MLWFKIETFIIPVTPKYGIVRSQYSRNSSKAPYLFFFFFIYAAEA